MFYTYINLNLRFNYLKRKLLLELWLGVEIYPPWSLSLYILKLKGDLVSFTIDNNIAIVKVLDMSLYNNILKLLSHL
ncbi:MAG: hypothetical protein KatS3mg068_2669 [Candidatus Sericytochromatia bacterium]|nr:MAG: hypothetical protein KatS3mg068_2669 [Candidatus Sericytochromatia bacterium]